MLVPCIQNIDRYLKESKTVKILADKSNEHSVANSVNMRLIQFVRKKKKNKNKTKSN